MKTRLLIVALMGLLVAGCNKSERPVHVVYGNVDMVVYSVKTNKKENKKHKAGKYEYWISDQTTGWALRTDKVFAVGDKLEITVSN